MADSPQSKIKSKDMYWFAHGGEPLPDKNHQQKSDGDDELGSPEQHNSPSWKPLQERKALPEETRSGLNGKECAAAVLDGAGNSPLLSLMERDDRVAVAPDSYGNGARMSGSSARASKNIEDQKSNKISEAEQDKNNAKARKKVERDAALEARRNAQRSNVSFAFGSSLPRNLDLDVTTVYQGSDLDRNKRRNGQASVSSQKSGPVTNIVPRTKKEGGAHMPLSLFATFENTQFEKLPSWISVNQPANCLVGSGAFVADDKMSQSMISPMSACRGRRKTDLTPTIPYERTAPPRTPVPPASSGKRSVSMTRLDQLARPRRSYVEAQRDHAKANSTSSTSSAQKDIQNSPSRPRSSASEHSAGSNRPSTTPPVNMRARTTSRKPRPVSIAGTMPDRKSTIEFKKDFDGHQTPEKKNEVSTTKKAPTVNKAKSPAPKNVHEKMGQKTPIKHLTPKSSPIRRLSTKAKKSAPAALSVSVEPISSFLEETSKISASPPESPAADEENNLGIPESCGKRIISEEEAKAALAEKRRLAREQAEKEAELERQHQEELKREEEERIRKEEEEQRKMEEEQLHLLEEHRKQEEEKLRKAIEEQEKKEQEEKYKREEEARLKAEQEKKAKEEAEKQRIELEEKLRKEEEERAERKKRLEKIMSRTRGKGASSAGSHSGGDQSDSADSQAGDTAEALSGNSSLNSIQSTDPSSGGASLEIHPESIQGSENESLNSMDMMALSENSSLDSNLLMLPSEGGASLDSDQASTTSNQNLLSDEKVTNDAKNLSFDHISSKDASVESNTLFSASGDNPSSYSSENDTVNTDTTIVPSEEKKNLNHLPVTSESDNMDSTSDRVLDFSTDFVQTLVSQSENSISSNSVNVLVSDQLVMENFATNDTSSEIFKMPAADNSEDFAAVKEDFAAVKEEDSVVKSEVNTFPNENQEICASESQEFIEISASNPFTVSSEPITEMVNNKHEVQDANESMMNLDNYMAASASEEGVNFVNTELNFSTPMAPSGNIYINEECCSESTDHTKSSIVETSELENSTPSPVASKKDLNVVIEDDENSSSKLFDGNSEQYIQNINMSQSFTSTIGIFNENSEQCLKSVEIPQLLNLDVTPFTESKTVPSDDNNMFPKEIATDLVKMDDSTSIITSVEELEPSAIHVVHTGANLCNERFVCASVTDSEDSSLDSNLSQVMNVNIIHNTISAAERSALNSSPLDIVSEMPGKTSTTDLDASCLPFQKMPQYISNDYAPTTNGYQSHVMESFACDNGVDGNFKTSGITEDCHSVSSRIDNEMNSNIMSPINNHHVENILNSGDINFNKVPSNPFLAADDTSEVSENLFLNQGEIMRNPIQTEFHA